MEVASKLDGPSLAFKDLAQGETEQTVGIGESWVRTAPPPAMLGASQGPHSACYSMDKLGPRCPKSPPFPAAQSSNFAVFIYLGFVPVVFNRVSFSLGYFS